MGFAAPGSSGESGMGAYDQYALGHTGEDRAKIGLLFA